MPEHRTPDQEKRPKSSAEHVQNSKENASPGLQPPPFQLKASGAGALGANIRSSAHSPGTVAQRQTDTPEQAAEEATQNAINAASQARIIHEAVDGWGTDEDAIYRTLLPLSREQIKLLKRTYASVYGNDLLEDLRDDLNDKELTKAMIYMFYWPFAHGTVLGSYQLGQAREKILELPGYSLDTYTDLLDIQPSAEHRAYVAKALAAGNTILEIIPFAYEISGKDQEWLSNNLRLTRQTDDGRGIQQSWQHSCGPTTVQAIQGELDPVYALSVRQNNPAIDVGNGVSVGPNTQVADDQKDMLEGAGGIAVPRGAGGGRWMSMGPMLNYIKDRTGIDYEVVSAGSDQASAMTTVDNILGQGLPVPIRVARVNNTGGHFCLITHKSGANYIIHDVWDGNSHTRSRADFTGHNMNIAGWPSFRHYGKPK